jgi:hypothetical protein
VSLAGSYIDMAAVVSGASTPLLGMALEPLKGLHPPNIHSLPQIAAAPGTLITAGRLARCVQVSVAML